MRWCALLVSSLATIACGRENIDPAYNFAFVTSTSHDPLMFGADLAMADAICAARAAEAGLPGPFVAYLDLGPVRAFDRLGNARGWHRTDGSPFSDRPVDVAEGTLLYPLRLDENGEDLGWNDVPVASGWIDAYGEGQCGTNYQDPAQRVWAGFADSASRGWSLATLKPCTSAVHLACFGTSFDTPLVVEPAEGRRAFVTVQSFTSVGGIAAADALCQQEATLAGLPGTYLALLPTSTATAASRFDLAGTPWVRVDGIQLASTPLAFMAGALDAPLNQTAVGTYVATYVLSAGGPSIVATSYACSDWTDPAGVTSDGRSDRSGDRAFRVDTGGAGCSAPVYCLQE